MRREARAVREANDGLETLLREKEEELARTREELARTRDEVTAEEQRARDYIHQAQLHEETAIRTFQSKLWEELQRYFSDLDTGWREKGLNADQFAHYNTLERIRNSLRQLGIPPGTDETEGADHEVV